MKLLRPLHRRRKTRRQTNQVMTSAELCAHFCLPRHQLEGHLTANHFTFHKDSQGEIWASLPKDGIFPKDGDRSQDDSPRGRGQDSGQDRGQDSGQNAKET